MKLKSITRTALAVGCLVGIAASAVPASAGGGTSTVDVAVSIPNDPNRDGSAEISSTFYVVSPTGSTDVVEVEASVVLVTEDGTTYEGAGAASVTINGVPQSGGTGDADLYGVSLSVPPLEGGTGDADLYGVSVTIELDGVSHTFDASGTITLDEDPRAGSRSGRNVLISTSP